MSGSSFSTINPNTPAQNQPIGAGVVRRQFDAAINDINGLYALYQSLAAQTGAATFVYTQASASASWVILHNLNRYPSVEIVDTAGNVCEGDIVYNSANQLTCTFIGAFAGQAYLN